MEMNFEKALLALEHIVEKLENGKLDLDESLVLFEQGIKLVNECNATLKGAQQKIEKLMEEHGNLTTTPFQLKDESTREKEIP